MARKGQLNDPAVAVPDDIAQQLTRLEHPTPLEVGLSNDIGEG